MSEIRIYKKGVADSLAALVEIVRTAAQEANWQVSGDTISRLDSVFTLKTRNQHYPYLVDTGDGTAYSDCELIELSVADGEFKSDMLGIWHNTGYKNHYGSFPPRKPQLPCSYHCFAYPEAIFCWFEVAPKTWNWFAFGVSELDGLPKKVPWFSTVDDRVSSFIPTADSAGCLFATNKSYVYDPWEKKWDYIRSFNPYGKFIMTTCRQWNAEPVFLPLRYFHQRGEMYSLAIDLEMTRLARLDYNLVGDIVKLGKTQWVVLPWYKRTELPEHSGDDFQSFYGKYKSGPFGIALRINDLLP